MHGGAAEHALPESSNICPVTKRAGNAASTPDAGPAKKARTDTPEIVPSSRTQLSWAQLEQRAIALPQSAEDVMELRRLGPDFFEATKRSGELRSGELLSSSKHCLKALRNLARCKSKSSCAIEKPRRHESTTLLVQ